MIEGVPPPVVSRGQAVLLLGPWVLMVGGFVASFFAADPGIAVVGVGLLVHLAHWGWCWARVVSREHAWRRPGIVLRRFWEVGFQLRLGRTLGAAFRTLSRGPS